MLERTCADWAAGVEHADWPVRLVATRSFVIDQAFEIVDRALDLTRRRRRVQAQPAGAALPRRAHGPLPPRQHDAGPRADRQAVPRHRPRRPTPLGLINRPPGGSLTSGRTGTKLRDDAADVSMSREAPWLSDRSDQRLVPSGGGRHLVLDHGRGWCWPCAVAGPRPRPRPPRRAPARARRPPRRGAGRLHDHLDGLDRPDPPPPTGPRSHRSGRTRPVADRPGDPPERALLRAHHREGGLPDPPRRDRGVDPGDDRRHPGHGRARRHRHLSPLQERGPGLPRPLGRRPAHVRRDPDSPDLREQPVRATGPPGLADHPHPRVRGQPVVRPRLRDLDGTVALPHHGHGVGGSRPVRRPRPSLDPDPTNTTSTSG